MRKFKRITSLLIVSVLAMSMVACSKGKDKTASSNEKNEEKKPYREAMADRVDAVKVAEYKVDYQKKYIFVDKEHKVYTFDNCGNMESEFVDGKNRVYIGLSTDKYHFDSVISLDNEVLLQYDRLYDASTDSKTYYEVIKDDKHGIIDDKNNVIVPIQYDNVDDENIYFYDGDEQPVIFIGENENEDGDVEKREYWTERGTKLDTTVELTDFKKVSGAYDDYNDAIIYATDSSYEEYYFDYETGKAFDSEKYNEKEELVYLRDDKTVVFCDKNLNEIKTVDIENIAYRNDRVTVYKDWVLVYIDVDNNETYKEEKTQIYDRKGNLLNEVDFCVANNGYGKLIKYPYGDDDYYIHYNKETFGDDQYTAVRVLNSEAQLLYEKKISVDDDYGLFLGTSKHIFLVHKLDGSTDSDLHTTYIVDITTGKELEDKYELAYAESCSDAVFYNVTKSQSEYFLSTDEIMARTGRVEAKSNLSYEFNYSYKEVDGKTQIIDDYTGEIVCTVDAAKDSLSFYPEIKCYKVNDVVYSFDGTIVYSPSED